MDTMMMHQYGMYSGFPDGLLTLLLPFLVWGIFWKGLGLWHSAKRGETVWFIVLLLVNTFGILDIIYLFLIAKIKWADLFTNK